MGFENCEDYTEKYGYECVPYYQCHNGTIITDGAGLIDIRNGFGSLTPEDSKCPGFLDVCCKDPDFIPPPPPKIKYAPKCGRRNQNGLGVRIQGFTESESQFGEWPHMCAILHEKPIEQEGAYAGEPQTVNLYQCGGSLIAPGVILTAAHCVDKFRRTPGVYASVSKALCWIDYAMSCHYGASTGDYNSYNGYTSNVCQDWMNNKIADLEKKRD